MQELKYKLYFVLLNLIIGTRYLVFFIEIFKII